MKEKELDKLDKAPMYRDKNFPSESEPTSSSGTGKDRRLDFGPIGFFISWHLDFLPRNMLNSIERTMSCNI